MWLTTLGALCSTALKPSCHETTASNNFHSAGLPAGSGCYSELRPGPCRALTQPESCFTFLLVTSVLAQSAAGSETQGLKWQQQPGTQHFTGLNYSAANTQPGTSPSLLSCSYFFFIAAPAECHLTAPGGEWKGLFFWFMWKQNYIFLCGRMQHSNHKNQKFMPGTICAIAVPVTESLCQYTVQVLQKSCMLVKCSRKSLTEYKKY